MPILLRKAGQPQPVGNVSPPIAFDPRFTDVVAKGAQLWSLYDQAVFSEGPVWWPAREILVWSDVEGRRVLGWHPDGRVEVVVDATPFTNGHTIDAAGNLIHCEHGSRALSCTTPDGRTSVLVRDYDGRRFNSPNDVTCALDGALWFTDPAFGLHSPRQGALDEPELDHRSVYRFDPRTGQVERMADFEQPNGLAFSPDGSTLYVSDTSQALSGTRHEIQAFNVTEGGRLSARRLFAVIEPGVPDGFRVDRRGWIWTSSGTGVQVFSDRAEKLGLIPTPQAATNCAFGPGERRLFITSQQHLYALDLGG
ncbi:SMP-30/gluconolactonase/LRE family protein [Methylobacterium oxalidis]|uniref:Gluconolactonase n=1 Tax=Methylobacterium oxalidis TaxID=944322 RepID=A0A512J1N4_9HYPH|nr:SMP-30/gluconolactonase/LRE family protein [Methylobacterium oxalidis]GEP03833.1 gluconolactonase [Methylobacterium oxalidis]GJE31293.1 Gluconolactonase [Methylobacterium oxalidis]GLS65309.1 gluconolactonase [Methylobacterium oxalidis]